MPPCRIEPDRSPQFTRLVKQLKKKYPHVRDDLEATFTDIEQDYTTACHATAIPGHDKRIWKYRCASSDMQRGRSGGFRIVAHYDSETQNLDPILIYAKADQSNVPKEEIDEAIKKLRDALEQGALPLDPDDDV